MKKLTKNFDLEKCRIQLIHDFINKSFFCFFTSHHHGYKTLLHNVRTKIHTSDLVIRHNMYISFNYYVYIYNIISLYNYNYNHNFFFFVLNSKSFQHSSFLLYTIFFYWNGRYI